MHKTLALLAALAASLPATAADRTVQGVDWEAVPWATFCPRVEAVELRTPAGNCPVSHPASQKHAAWKDFGMETKQPPPNCKHAEHEYRWWTTPASGKKQEETWAACEHAWRSALNRRAREPASFEEPFEQWRERYFGRWLASQGK